MNRWNDLREGFLHRIRALFVNKSSDSSELLTYFFIEEEELCRISRPVYLEASIGMGPYDGSGGDLDTKSRN